MVRAVEHKGSLKMPIGKPQLADADIAILRTMGATRASIMRIFLIAGMSIGVVGTLAGFLIGVLFCNNIESIRQLLQHMTGVTIFDPAIYFLSHMPAQIDTNDVVAVVGNTSITLAEVDRKAMQQSANGFGSMKLVLAVYEARKNAIEEIAGEKLIDIEAKARGVTTTALIDQEIT